jgi:RNA polymerase sigma-70 factor (ECF subfamily)
MTSRTDHSPSETPEAELILRAQRGDLGAFSQLMERVQGRIYGLLYNMTSSKEDAEDLLQEVFIKAHASLPKFKGQSSFYTWVYRIAVNRAINFVKKRKKRQGLSLDDLDLGIERDPALVEMSSSETPDRNIHLKELQEKLNTALQELSEKHRTVVIMHDIQGMPHHEIADVIGCSPGTVRSRLFYARRELQSILSEVTS